MPKFSKRSLDRLETCDVKLQEICYEAIEIMDFSVLCGHRGKEEQEEAYNNGHSNAKWGESEHNSKPSKAVDIAPYPINWNDKERFARLAGVIEAIAHRRRIKIKWGGDFESFQDMPHFELV